VQCITISGDRENWAAPSSCPAAGASVRPISAGQGSLAMKQSLIPASGEERGTHNAASKSEGKSSPAIWRFEGAARVVAPD
jgi:hypothetical protein